MVQFNASPFAFPEPPPYSNFKMPQAPPFDMPQAPTLRRCRSRTAPVVPSAPDYPHEAHQYAADIPLRNEPAGPGWCVPRGHQQIGFDHPVPINGVAIHLNRRESAPESTHSAMPQPNTQFSPPDLNFNIHAHNERSGFQSPRVAPPPPNSGDFPAFLNPALFPTHLSEEPASYETARPAATRQERSCNHRPPPIARQLTEAEDTEDDSHASAVLEAAVRDVQTIKQVFDGWHDQLFTESSKHAKVARPFSRTEAFEKEILLRFENLQQYTETLFKTAQAMLENFKDFVRTSKQSQAFNQRQSERSLKRLGDKLSNDTKVITENVEKMRGKLHDIVKTIEDATRHAERRAVRDKVLRVFIRALKVLNAGANLGAAIAGLAPTAEGMAASATLGGLNLVLSAAANAADNFRKDHTSETGFELTLKLLKTDIPDALKTIDLTLGSVRACQKFLNLDMRARDALRRASTDASAQRALQNAGLCFEDIQPLLFLTPSLF